MLLTNAVFLQYKPKVTKQGTGEGIGEFFLMPVEVASHENLPELQHRSWQVQGHENNMRKPTWEQKWENTATSAIVRLENCKCRGLIFRRVKTLEALCSIEVCA